MAALTQRLASEVPCTQRHRLQRQLADIERQSRAGKAIDNVWQQWLGDFQAASEQVRQRIAGLPEIHYPDLPVSERADEIAALIRQHQVVIVAGETGSGKTTQLPKICLQAGCGVRGLIGHTQPRRIAARSVAARIAEELKTPLGEAVGYQVRFTDQTSVNSYIKLMTDGILLAEIQRDRFLNQYDTIIIDEAHERSLNIDFLLGYLKQLLPKRPDLKLVITSATIDQQKFARHFGDAPIVEVSGRTYPVEIIYNDPDDLDNDRDQMIVDCLREINSHKKSGDVLVFLSGEREIREVSQAIRHAKLLHLDVVPLYARLSIAEQNKIFAPHRGRRVVLSTNVAETSLTVPGIRYVIDTGRARVSRYSYRSKVQRLPIEAISQASANQRAGRCGRVSEGVCYRLYSEEDFNSRPAYTDPEIIRTNLAAVILQMLHLRIGDIRDFPFVDAPDSRLIRDGYQLLEELQAVDLQGRLSELGKQLVRLPVDPRFGRMLLAAAENGALSEVMVIVAALSIQDPRERPADKRQAADEKHRQWADDESDFAALLNLWHHFEVQRQALSRNQFGKYCHQNFISYLRMREWRDLHHQVHTACRQLGLKENRQPVGYDAMHQSLLAGLLGQVAVRYEKAEFDGTRNRKFALFPTTPLAKKPPKWIVAGELMETSRQWAINVARIEPEWLESLARHLVKCSYSEPYYHRKSGQVMAREKQTLYGLTIIDGKRVPYGKIAPAEAREIFIRQALVEGNYGGGGAFFAHNQRLVEELEALESRMRRRDLLAEEEVIYQFYNERIPDTVCNKATFDKWRKSAEKQQPKLLYLNKDTLMLRTLSDAEQAQFPDHIRCQGFDYPLSYHFEPGHEEDGVSVKIPLPLLHQAPHFRFEWLVPGMLRDKIILLLKTLPKPIRKQLVPVPDFADAILRRIQPQDRPLLEVIAEALMKIGGIAVSEEDWQADKLDNWYLMNFVLVDEQGERLAMARSLKSLQSQFREQIDAGLAAAPDDQFCQSGMTSWDFGKLPELVTLDRSGLQVRAWPSLVDRGDSVAIELQDNPLLAESISRQGQLRLACLTAKEQVKYLNKHLLRGKELALRAAGVPERADLVAALTEAAMREALFSDGEVMREQAQFQYQLEQGVQHVVPLATGMGQSLESLLEPLHQISKTLRKLGLSAIYARDDIQQQIARLFAVQAIRQTSEDQLRQYARYVRAIAIRLEKLHLQVAKDRQSITFVEKFAAPLNGVLDDQRPLPEALRSELWAFRWTLEEYRVSLFAQQLKTREPVSEQRLQKRWAELEDQLRRVSVAAV